MGKMRRTPIEVVAGLIWRQGRLLICQRKETDAFPCKWEFPGGKVEPNEVPPVRAAEKTNNSSIAIGIKTVSPWPNALAGRGRNGVFQTAFRC